MDYDRGLAAIGSVKGSIPFRNVSEISSSSFQRVMFRLPWDISVREEYYV